MITNHLLHLSMEVNGSNSERSFQITLFSSDLSRYDFDEKLLILNVRIFVWFSFKRFLCEAANSISLLFSLSWRCGARRKSLSRTLKSISMSHGNFICTSLLFTNNSCLRKLTAQIFQISQSKQRLCKFRNSLSVSAH